MRIVKRVLIYRKLRERLSPTAVNSELNWKSDL